MMKSTNTKGFTLVELIIVITILAILATIAFLSFQSYTKDARNSKRESDLNSIARAIEVKVASAVPIANFVKTPVSMDDLRVKQGFGGVVSGYILSNFDNGESQEGKYKAGYINFDILSVDEKKFKDPKADSDYLIGTTTFHGGVYELETRNYEKDSGTGSKIVGNWKPRTQDILDTINITATGSNFIIIDAGLGILRVGDILDDGVPGNVISGISNDLTKITFSDDITTGFTSTGTGEILFFSNEDEIEHLICNGNCTGS